MNNDELKPLFTIDLGWYQEAGRSFSALARSRLCPACQKKHPPIHSRTDSELLDAIRDCCSHKEGFITPYMPLLEMIFRILLANGAQPMGLEEIQELLRRKLNTFGEFRDTSTEILERLIKGDDYYGLRPVNITDESPSSEEDAVSLGTQ